MQSVIRRIVGCQGSIQLLTAVSVLLYREFEQLNNNIVYENYLVIYDLYTPKDQDRNFALFIEALAKQLCAWNQITYICPQQVVDIRKNLTKFSPQQVEKTIFDLLGISKADEIYLARNWQFCNQLLINVFKDSEKICYGDSIGCYLAPTSIYSSSKHLAKIKKEIRKFISFVIQKTIKKTFLDEVEFDRAYMLLPEGMGHIPNMQVTIPKKDYLVSVIKQSESILSLDLINPIRCKVRTRKSIAILMTSNFSEQNIISLDSELLAYHDFLANQKVCLPKESLLIIKPHPRDSPSKLARLTSNLESLFLEIILLDDMDFFFCPFEIIFNAMLLSDSGQQVPHSEIHIFALSSACLSFKLIYDSCVHIGFGSDLVHKYFYPQFSKSRIEHEEYLNESMLRIQKSI